MVYSKLKYLPTSHKLLISLDTEFIFMALQLTYVLVLAFLALLVVSFVISTYRKFGFRNSLLGFIQDDERLSHGIIFQIIIGVLFISASLAILGYLKVTTQNPLIILAPIVIVSTILGFHNTSVGTAVGLFGGSFGPFLYSIIFESISYYLQFLWLWMLINLAGYVTGWLAGTIVIGQKKCEVAAFLFEVKIMKIEQAVYDLPMAIYSIIVNSFQETGLGKPVLKKSFSGSMISSLQQNAGGAMKFSQTMFFASKKRRMFAELRNLWTNRSRYKTPSQLLSAFLNMWLAYKIEVTLKVFKGKVNVGVVAFCETPSIIWAPLDIRGLCTKVYDGFLKYLISQKISFKSISEGPVVVSFLDFIAKSHQFKVETFGEKQTHPSGPISRVMFNSLKHIESFALRPTLIDKIREISSFKWVILAFNALLTFIFGRLLEILMKTLI